MIKPVFVYYTPTQIVVILSEAFDLEPVRTGWMEDPDLPEGLCEIPCIDLDENKFLFPRSAQGEYDAFRKVAELYAFQLVTQ